MTRDTVSGTNSAPGLFDLVTAGISGFIEMRPRVRDDNRGRFVKVFHRDAFAANGLNTDFAEEYYSVSRRGVIRGLHFQRPPLDHVKLVYCVHGQVQDVVLDLRRGSPTYGRHAVVELSAELGNMVYIPPGFAHGFCARSDTAIVIYKVSTAYSPDHDAGILWNSAGIQWATEDPILSDRDRDHPSFAAFESPFSYAGAP